MEEKVLRSLELNVLGLLSSFPLSSLSLLLVLPHSFLSQMARSHMEGRRLPNNPSQEDRTLSFQASWNDPQHWICLEHMSVPRPNQSLLPGRWALSLTPHMPTLGCGMGPAT